jgi:dihydroneopterin aldolase
MQNTRDIIHIQHIQAHALIGFYPRERETKQPLRVDIAFATDAAKIAVHDDINHAINYRSVSEHIMQYIAQSEYYLIETLAHDLAQSLQTTFPIPWLRLTLSKPGALAVEQQAVSICIERVKTQ